MPSSTSREAGLPLAIDWLGTVPYAEALEKQEAALEARRAGR